MRPTGASYPWLVVGSLHVQFNPQTALGQSPLDLKMVLVTFRFAFPMPYPRDSTRQICETILLPTC
jgi:hypothetical protein